MRVNHAHSSKHSGTLPIAATLGALVVVYGDIGTSPLYALKEAAKAAAHGRGLAPEAILGVVLLILWSLILIISLQILCADNRGEGCMVALLALLSATNAEPGTWRAQLLIVGLVGAALLYGDGAITPAISVLSAIEGLKIDAPSLVPLSVVILIGLAVQKKGAGFVGGIFGPVMLGWFLAIAVLGIYGMVRAPAVLAALSPTYAINLMIQEDFYISFAILGAARGTRSDFVPTYLMEQMKRRAPHMTTFELADTVHMPMLMSPEEINATERFLMI